MKNNKGFTLIELIAVVVMMGMILLVVFPATSRLLRGNENKKYDSYYESTQEAIELYARTRRDELGGIEGEGCVDDKKLSELKSYDYINEFKDEKDVTCLSPGDFTTDRLAALGIDTSKQYVNVRISNKKGKISVDYSMICVRNLNDPSITSVLYSNLIERKGTCEVYIPVVTNSLINEIKEKYTTYVQGTSTMNYVTGNPNNNYVLYSGIVWRIVGFDTAAKTIKLVTDSPVATISYNNITQDNNYSNSNVYLWLKNIFLPTLRNTDKYLKEVEWNYSNTTANVSSPIVGGSTVLSKIGLLNNFEYLKSANFINNGKKTWLISTSGTSAWSVNAAGEITLANVLNFYGIRPSVVLKENINFVNGGTGTINNPYKLIGDTSANVGTALNSRYPGEYVTLNGILFRISSAYSNYTKLVATDTIPIDSNIASTIPYITSSYYNSVAGTIRLHYFNETYSDDTYIGEYLKKWAEPIEDILTEGDFCRRIINKNSSQTIECPPEDIISTKIAIPMLGEMYAVYASNNYWTINNSAQGKMDIITNDGSARDINVTELSSILPVVVIKNDAIITGGNGTSSSPYTIE